MPIYERFDTLTPPKHNIPLWRYMDIPAFVSLLVSESLTFVRADLFEDKFEGKIPIKTAAMLDSFAQESVLSGKLNKEYVNLSEVLNRSNRNVYLNCWCKESFEMVHMWKIYSKVNGVAIETDYESLKSAIKSEDSIFPTEVNYIDFDNDIIDYKSNSTTVLSFKRKEYKSENEFRLILSGPKVIHDHAMNVKDSGQSAILMHQLYQQTPVVGCLVDIKQLIRRIHVSPYAPKWYLPTIQGLVRKFDLDKIIISQSVL